jgi:hypothetical protein
MQFHPFLTGRPGRREVSFPNLDPTKHHVYSFSPAKRFELKLFAKDQSRSVHFDKPGVVALGCNIHDAMTAFIVVTDSAWTARTNAQGWRSSRRAQRAGPAVTGLASLSCAPREYGEQASPPAQRARASFAAPLRAAADGDEP